MKNVRAKEEKKKQKEQKLAAQKEAKEKKKAELQAKKAAANKSKTKNKQIKVPGLASAESDDVSSLGTVSLHSDDEASAEEGNTGGLNLASIDKKVISRYRKAMMASCKDPDPEE